MLTTNDIDKLLAGHFSGELKAEDEKILDQWIKESEENETYFLELTSLYQNLAGAPMPSFHSETALQNFKNYMDRDEEQTSTNSTRKSGKFIYTFIGGAVAAAILAYFVFIPEKEKYNTFNENMVYSLANSSEINVYEGEVMIDKNTANDTIYMKGKVSFKLDSQKNGSSIIKVENLFVKDIGTNFAVDASNPDSVNVNVQDGVVLFYNEYSGVELFKGDSAYYLTKNKTFYKTAYRGDFLFQEKPLNEIIEELSLYYGRNIVIKDTNARTLSIHVDFRNEDLATILDIICTTLNLKLKYQDNQYLIYSSESYS